MKVWLDDERNPRDPFVQEEFGAEPDMVWAKSAGRAIQLLDSGQVDSISLDHDLGRNAGTGYDVAKWIEQQAFNQRIPRLMWAIHSRNPVGRKRMQQALMNADEYWSKYERR